MESQSSKIPRRVFPFLLLLSLFALQYFVFVHSSWPGNFQWDENYYLQKAKTLTDQESSRTYRADRWRTSAYPQFIALCNLPGVSFDNVRFRVAFVQWMLALVVAFCFYIVASQALDSSRWLFLIAFITGLQPWSFDFSRRLYADSLTASLFSMGVLSLFAFIKVRKGIFAGIFLMISVLFMSATISLRLEMLVIVPLLFMLGIALKTWGWRNSIKLSAIFALLIVAVTGITAGNRLTSMREVGVFGKFALGKPGGLAWVHTWLATERSAFNNFLIGNSLSQSKFELLPDRAFADASEREEIRKACELSEKRGKYDQDVDRIFRDVAEKRKQENFLMNSAIARIWGTAHLWINLDPGEQWLHLISRNSSLFPVLILFFLSFKLIIFYLAAVSVFRTIQLRSKEELRWYHALTILMIFSLIARTLLMGGMIGYIHRYILPAWPAMVWCALSACIDLGSDDSSIMRKYIQRNSGSRE